MSITRFDFVQGNERLDWGVLVAIDIQRLMQECNVDTLQRVVENLAFARVTRDEAAMFAPEHTMHLFQLCQLVIQYLVYSQECLAKMNIRLNACVEESNTRASSTERARTALRQENEVLKKEIKTHRRTLLAYEYGARAHPSHNAYRRHVGGAREAHSPRLGVAVEDGAAFRCPVCNEGYQHPASLESHMRKRHPQPSPISATVPPPLQPAGYGYYPATHTLSSVQQQQQQQQPCYYPPPPRSHSAPISGGTGETATASAAASSPSAELDLLVQRMAHLESQVRDNTMQDLQKREQLLMTLLQSQANHPRGVIAGSAEYSMPHRPSSAAVDDAAHASANTRAVSPIQSGISPVESIPRANTTSPPSLLSTPKPPAPPTTQQLEQVQPQQVQQLHDLPSYTTSPRMCIVVPDAADRDLSNIPVMPDIAAAAEYNASRAREAANSALLRHMLELQDEVRALRQTCTSQQQHSQPDTRRSQSSPTPNYATDTAHAHDAPAPAAAAVVQPRVPAWLTESNSRSPHLVMPSAPAPAPPPPLSAPTPHEQAQQVQSRSHRHAQSQEQQAANARKYGPLGPSFVASRSVSPANSTRVSVSPARMSVASPLRASSPIRSASGATTEAAGPMVPTAIPIPVPTTTRPSSPSPASAAALTSPAPSLLPQPVATSIPHPAITPAEAATSATPTTSASSTTASSPTAPISTAVIPAPTPASNVVVPIMTPPIPQAPNLATDTTPPGHPHPHSHHHRHDTHRHRSSIDAAPQPSAFSAMLSTSTPAVTAAAASTTTSSSTNMTTVSADRSAALLPAPVPVPVGLPSSSRAHNVGDTSATRDAATHRQSDSTLAVSIPTRTSYYDDENYNNNNNQANNTNTSASNTMSSTISNSNLALPTSSLPSHASHPTVPAITAPVLTPKPAVPSSSSPANIPLVPVPVPVSLGPPDSNNNPRDNTSNTNAVPHSSQSHRRQPASLHRRPSGSYTYSTEPYSRTSSSSSSMTGSSYTGSSGSYNYNSSSSTRSKSTQRPHRIQPSAASMSISTTATPPPPPNTPATQQQQQQHLALSTSASSESTPNQAPYTNYLRNAPPIPLPNSTVKAAPPAPASHTNQFLAVPSPAAPLMSLPTSTKFSSRKPAAAACTTPAVPTPRAAVVTAATTTTTAGSPAAQVARSGWMSGVMGATQPGAAAAASSAVAGHRGAAVASPAPYANLAYMTATQPPMPQPVPVPMGTSYAQRSGMSATATNDMMNGTHNMISNIATVPKNTNTPNQSRGINGAVTRTFNPIDSSSSASSSGSYSSSSGSRST